MYYITVSPSGQEVIIFIDGNVMISMLENHESVDYQRYLAWLAKGKTPKPYNP
jgi:hypothetical protein